MSAVSILKAGQRSARCWAWLGLLAVLVAGCHAHPSGHGPGREGKIGFLPLLICLGVFFLILFVKRPWRVLGGLVLAFVVFLFLGLAIPAFQVARHNPWHAVEPAETHREAVVGSHGQVIWQGSDDHAEMVVEAGQPSAAVTSAIAISGEKHVDEDAGEDECDVEHAEAADHEGPAEHAAEVASAESPPTPEVASEAPAAPPSPEPQVQPDVPADAVVVAKAPDWIKDLPHLDPRTNTYIEVVHTGTTTTAFELQRKLDQELVDVTRTYLANTDDPRAANMHVPVDYLRNKVVKQQHTETVRRQFDGPAGYDDPGAVAWVQETWARLEYGPEVQRDLALMWDQELAQRRLWQVGGLGGLVMAVLASALGYLRLDTATKGYYTRTLRWGAATVILGLVAAGLLLAG